MASSSPKLSDSLQLPANLNMSKTFYAVGIVGLIASAVGYFLDTEQFLHSYLTSFTFFTSIALASLFFVMIHHLTKSSWGTVVRRIPEAFISNIWIWAIFVIPVMLGVTNLYNWATPEYVSGDPIMEGKVPYLNVPFFVARQFIY